MAHHPTGLSVTAFDPAAFPAALEASDQVQYLRCYLADLNAQAVVEEPYYFDRDYLSEFSTFYSTSARGYSNACRRIHVFAMPLQVLRACLAAALMGIPDACAKLNEGYLGFVVVRPIAATPLGRTVLRWYPETQPERRRVTNPSRWYSVHLAGLELRVFGLAWQQQDTAVGACATVALWTMFHSSALDEHHAIPTTAEITKAASARWPLGRRVFPATDGLSIHQVCEAIRAQGLQPAVLEGDVQTDDGRFFSRRRFAASCAALIRSGYPVLIGGLTVPGWNGHAVCAVGFRPGGTPAVSAGDTEEDDGGLLNLYLHDDNLGPSVRFAVDEFGLCATQATVALLRPDSPQPLHAKSLPDPTQTYWSLLPTAIVAALPDEIRMSIDDLHARGIHLSAMVSKFIAALAQRRGAQVPGVTFATRVFRLKDYLGAELAQRLSGRRLGKARLALISNVGPMSLHIGVVRVAIAGTPMFDVLYDTTDSTVATSAFAHVMFQNLPVSWLGKLGVPVPAF